jgi:hypothetical protein
VQRELGGLANHTAQQQQRGYSRIGRGYRPVDGRVDDAADPVGARGRSGDEDPEQQSHVAEPSDQKGLDRAGSSLRELPMVTDQVVGASPHHLPADQQYEQVVSHHDQGHRRGEDRDQRAV